MELKDLTGLIASNKITIALAGGGGKTTLMFFLARQLSSAGKKVLVTTTTHIFKPNTCYALDEEQVLKLWNDGKYAVIGSPDPKNIEKLMAPEGDLLEVVNKKADVILIEADGAKRMPCKIPGPWEPVIPPDCDLVIGVMGMRALGHPLSEVCFRYNEEGQWLDAEKGSILDEDMAVRILTSDKGTKKGVGHRRYVVVLSQCDDADTRMYGEEITKKLEMAGVDCCIADLATVGL